MGGKCGFRIEAGEYSAPSASLAQVLGKLLHLCQLQLCPPDKAEKSTYSKGCWETLKRKWGHSECVVVTVTVVVAGLPSFCSNISSSILWATFPTQVILTWDLSTKRRKWMRATEMVTLELQRPPASEAVVWAMLLWKNLSSGVPLWVWEEQAASHRSVLV